MAEFTRAIVSRVRQYVGDRRRSRRHAIRLNFLLTLISPTKHLNGARRVSTIEGHTLDISAHGLALVVPRITLGEHHLVGENRSFNLKLELPDGPVELQASPVRYERLDEDTNETGYLIAVRIVGTPTEDVERYGDFVASLPRRSD